jgi:hydrogenase expression/formation protein HypE
MDDYILLAHGNGGKFTSRLIQSCFLPYLKDPALNRLNDQAIVDVEGCRVAFTTDSFVVHPLSFPGGDIGRLAVCGTVNDLAVGGAIPLYLSAGFIIEEGFAQQELRKISASLSAAAMEAGVRIVTADTKVVEKGACDKLFINTSGIGIISRGVDLGPHQVRPGDTIILSGYLGDHGIAILSSRKGIEFDTSIISDCAPLNLLVNDMLPHAHAIRAMRDPTRGGLGTLLNEIARQSGTGITIHEDRLPVREEVQGVCEILGLDPLYLPNEGRLVAFVEAGHADAVLAAMKKNPLGRDSCIIGETTEKPAGTVIMETRVGGSRMIDMLVAEDLPRIC